MHTDETTDDGTAAGAPTSGQEEGAPLLAVALDGGTVPVRQERKP